MDNPNKFESFESLEQDIFARIAYCHPILRPGDSLVDAAKAWPIGPYWDATVHTPAGRIKRPTAIIEAAPGMWVCKSGRTSGYHCGRVVMIHAAVEVNYGPYNIRSFKDQIITDHIGDPGDSGSLVITLDASAMVAQLFAGNTDRNIVSPIKYMLDALSLLPGCPDRQKGGELLPEEPLGAYRLSLPVLLSDALMLPSVRCTE
jgi:hypothetical protein